MANISEIISERNSLENELAEITREFEKRSKDLSSRIALLKQKEEIVKEGLDLDKIELGRSFISVCGNPYALTDDNRDGKHSIAKAAIDDILNGCRKLKSEYFGNKVYGSYYQRCDCEYHYGPTHGSIVDEIGLRDRERIPTTPEEIEVSVYYLSVYEKIPKITKND